MTVDADGQLRLASIRTLDVLGKPARRDLNAVAEVAARLCGVATATINMLTDTEQHAVATAGFEGSVTPLEDSMCKVTLATTAPVVVADARVDARFRDNPWVTGELGHVRFYAAHRLVSPEGVPIGTLCVFDSEPHEVDTQQVDAIGTLAERVVDMLELSLLSRELSSTLAEVQAVRADLEQSNERLAYFAGQISHDLKTPLTSIGLSLSLFREELIDAEAVPHALPLLDRAINGSERMGVMVDDVLAFARLGADLRRRHVDLNRVADDVRSDLGHALDGVSLVVHRLPVVLGDEAQLRAVLQNLVHNAAKYGVPGRSPHVEVGARRSLIGWRIEVTDDGRGVSLAQHERIFRPFYRTTGSTTGMGIGLVTCRRIVEAHGGRMGLDPITGGGTMAWFELPHDQAQIVLAAGRQEPPEVTALPELPDRP